jgi:hypothetical protein
MHVVCIYIVFFAVTEIVEYTQAFYLIFAVYIFLLFTASLGASISAVQSGHHVSGIGSIPVITHAKASTFLG